MNTRSMPLRVIRTCTVLAVAAALTVACGTDEEPGTATNARQAGESSPSPDAARTFAVPDVERVDPSAFDYDDTAPLNLTEDPEALLVDVPAVDVRAITYDSPHGGQVTGYVAHPAEGESETALIVMHGVPERAIDYVEIVAGLACAGATALTIDAAHVRAGSLMPYRWSENERWAETDVAEHIQTVVDLRRAVDVLESMGAERIVYDGVSWSSTIGAVLAGVEPRIDGYALMAGGTITGRFLRDGRPVSPLNVEPDEVVEDWLELMASVDATQYVGDATSPILFQNGRDDTTITSEDASTLHAAAGPDHEVRWYDGVGHDLSPELIEDHVRWMADILGLDADRVDACVSQYLLAPPTP